MTDKQCDRIVNAINLIAAELAAHLIANGHGAMTGENRARCNRELIETQHQLSFLNMHKCLEVDEPEK